VGNLKTRLNTLMALFGAAALMCASSVTHTSAAPASAAAPSAGGAPADWRPLFDGRNLDAWRGWMSPGFPTGWHVAAGILTKQGSVEDLVTRDEFGNFELELEWNIGKGGNSGIFYRATREYDRIYWSGPEYQLLDDANHPDGRKRVTAAGSAYALYAPPAGVVRPFDHWNKTRIIVNGAHVEHWLNGQKVVEYELWSADWSAKVAAGKFAKYPNYGLAKKGHIGIQGDHDGELRLRNIRIRELP
jgi:hypothetical protein